MSLSGYSIKKSPFSYVSNLLLVKLRLFDQNVKISTKIFFLKNHAPKVQILSFGQRVFSKKKEKIDGNFSSVKESRKSNKNKFAINLFGLVWYDC